ncbi:MAG: zinc ribbon domain-containing protein [Chloroflexota bacterium]|nr:zinc ribbon domain-containing protein [Chloroflexota bacterium]
MPIYEYKCRDCGDKFEKLVRSLVRPTSSEEDLKCPVCRSPKVERQVSLCGYLTSSGAADSGAGSASSSSCAPSGGG